MLLVNIQHPIQVHLPTIMGNLTERFQYYRVVVVVVIQEAAFHRPYVQDVHSLHYSARIARYSAHL